jgi:HAD superfamily hydrolase (TIGR01490 family)
MTLAIFDLDNTLLSGDSDHAWGLFLAELNVVDANHHRREQERYYMDYVAGKLDIHEFLRFQLRALKDNDPGDLTQWRERFVAEKILPMISRHAYDLVQRHRAQGHTLMIITATNRFITQPIAREFDVDVLIATEPEMVNGRFTGEVQGIPCFQDGKVALLNAWLTEHGADLNGSWCYTDSHNDLSLMQLVDHPVAVNPDTVLTAEAKRHGWPILEFQHRDVHA